MKSDLPAHWKRRPLSECGTWLSGGTPAKWEPAYWGGEIPWVGPKDLHVRYVDDAEEYLTELGAANGTRLAPENSILVVVRSMALAKRLQIGLARRAVAFNQDIKAILPAGDVRPRFLFFALWGCHDELHRLVDEASHGTKRLRTDVLGGYQMPIPPLAEQERIAATLGALDDKIDSNRRLAQLLDAASQAQFDRLMVAASNGLPDGWQELPLRELAEINAKSHSARDHPDELIYVDISSVAPRRILERRRLRYADAPSRARRIVRSGDTLVSTVRPERRAMTFVERAEPNLTASTGFAVITPIRGAPTFVYRAATSDAFIDYLTAAATGSAYPAVNPAVLAGWRVPTPPDMGSDFEGSARPIEASIGRLERESATLAAVRDELVPKLVSGEIRVADSADPGEAVESLVEEHAA
jgi:type I restriction enzyme, S subunit